MTFLTILGVTEILCSFRLVLEGKTGKEIPESSRLEFIEKFSANNFNLSDAKDNTSKLLNQGAMVDLPLLRTLIGNSSKVPRCKFLAYDGLSCFILEYASFAVSGTLLQPLLACLKFTLDSEDLFCW